MQKIPVYYYNYKSAPPTKVGWFPSAYSKVEWRAIIKWTRQVVVSLLILLPILISLYLRSLVFEKTSRALLIRVTFAKK